MCVEAEESLPFFFSLGGTACQHRLPESRYCQTCRSYGTREGVSGDFFVFYTHVAPTELTRVVEEVMG